MEASLGAKGGVMAVASVNHLQKETCNFFQMPLHYPRYTKVEYEKMPEWKLDRLLAEYGLSVAGDLAYKREFAKGAFLWSSH